MSSEFRFKTCVGVPVFNEEAYIADTLLSLKKQDVEARFLISDNASTDRTPEIIADVIQGDSRFELIRQPQNIGSVQNFPYLFENSFSEYFMWLGGHDLVSENFLQPLVAILDEKPDVAIAAGMPWKVEEGQAPELVHEGVYEFSDPVPINRYLKSVAEISNCTLLHSLFRRVHVDNYTSHALGWDKVLLSRLLWFGRLEYHAQARYFRRYFPIRTEKSEERMRGSEDLSLAPFEDTYLEDFAKLVKPALPQHAYNRHVETMAKLILGGNIQRRFYQARKRAGSLKEQLIAAQAKAAADAAEGRKQLTQTQGKLRRVQGQLAKVQAKAQADAAKYKKRLQQRDKNLRLGEKNMRSIARELAETKRLLDMTVVSRLLAVYHSLKARRKSSRSASGNAQGSATHLGSQQ